MCISIVDVVIRLNKMWLFWKSSWNGCPDSSTC